MLMKLEMHLEEMVQIGRRRIKVETSTGMNELGTIYDKE